MNCEEERESAALLLSVLASLGASRRLRGPHAHLRSDPPGAAVVVNGADAGIAPVKLHFKTYGAFEVVLAAPRYQRLRAKVPVEPPWYEQIPIDFFAETLWPFTLRDDHVVTLKLEPLSETKPPAPASMSASGSSSSASSKAPRPRRSLRRKESTLADAIPRSKGEPSAEA